MLTLSIAQIQAIALAVLAGFLWLKQRGAARRNPFLLLAIAGAAQATLVSLRWDFGVTGLQAAQVVIACLLPALAWHSFRYFAGVPHELTDVAHAAPALAALLAFFAAPDLIDPIIIATYIGYAIAFARLLLRGESALDHAAINGLPNLRRTLQLVTFSLAGSAIIDTLVLADLIRTQGAYAAQIISAGNAIMLFALAISIVAGSGAITSEENDDGGETPSTSPSATDTEIAARVDSLLISGLAKDPDLTLKRIASRLTLPTRAVSQAINRVHGCNVSQHVNAIRIAEARRLLQSTDMPVTQVMFESGFLTKSNFNREFLRVTGKTPRQLRLCAMDAKPSRQRPAAR